MLSQAIIAKMIKMAIVAVIEWHNMGPNMVSMERAGKMQIAHESGIKITATVQKLWPNQNLH